MKDVKAFVRTAFDAVDSMDSQNLVPFLHEDCTFYFANEAPVAGRGNVLAFMQEFMGLIGGIRHDVEGAWKVDDRIVGQVQVTYTRKDSTEWSGPAAVIWTMREDRIVDYRAYVNNTPLFSA